MENTMTRIADLPMDNGQGLSNGLSNQGAYSPMVPNASSANQQGNTPTNYIPINVHPNPYGISNQNPIMPNPQQTSAPQQGLQSQGFAPPPGLQTPGLQTPGLHMPQSQYAPEDQQQMLAQMPTQRLPSRDIPRDTTGYLHDEQVQANYIPQKNISSDYVRDYEDMTEKNRIEYENKKRRENRLDVIFTELQTPVFIAILFFFFQLPSVNTYLFKNLAFLAIYNVDGNFNFNGLLLKSIAFGSLYYIVTKTTAFLSEI